MMMLNNHLCRSMVMVIAGIAFGAVVFVHPALLLALDSTEKNAPVSDAETSGKSVVHLYFSDQENSFLTAEERVFLHSDHPVDFSSNIINALIAGSRKGLVQTIPAGTRLRALYVTHEGVAFVDLSEAVKDGHPGGVKSEMLTIFSIVNSLVLNISQVNAVKILINGSESTTLAGHVDLRFPFKANMLMIR